jgi:hypothetical protein
LQLTFSRQLAITFSMSLHFTQTTLLDAQWFHHITSHSQDAAEKLNFSKFTNSNIPPFNPSIPVSIMLSICTINVKISVVILCF